MINEPARLIPAHTLPSVQESWIIKPTAAAAQRTLGKDRQKDEKFLFANKMMFALSRHTLVAKILFAFYFPLLLLFSMPARFAQPGAVTGSSRYYKKTLFPQSRNTG